MDTISTSGAQKSYRSLGQEIAQATMGKIEDQSKACFKLKDTFTFSEEFLAALKPSDLKRYEPDTIWVERVLNVSLTFADISSTTTVESMEQYFKNGNLADTYRIRSLADDGDRAEECVGLKLTSIEAEPNLANGNGLSVNTKQQTTVNLKRVDSEEDSPPSYQFNISRNDGFQLNFVSNDNVRINDLEDGGLSIVYASTGETHIYDAEGNKKDVLQGEAGALTGTEGDDLLINLHGTSVDGGDGDDTIVNFADNATVKGGNGDDTILLGRTVDRNTIDTGEGNDHLLGLGVQNGSAINMGEGNNRVQLGFLGRASELRTGDGNNEVTIGTVCDDFGSGKRSAIHLGNGNNTLRSHELSGALRLGNGDNIIDAYRLGGNTVLGNGNNNIEANYLSGRFIGGHGNNTFSVDHVETHGDSPTEVYLGNGNNTMAVDWFFGASITMGNGNNTAYVDSLRFANLNMGDGNNTTTIDSLYQGNANFGDGDNTIKVDSLGESRLTVGDGNNEAEINMIGSQSRVAFGAGRNTVAVGSNHRGNLIASGDTILLNALKNAANTPQYNSAVSNMNRNV